MKRVQCSKYLIAFQSPLDEAHNFGSSIDQSSDTKHLVVQTFIVHLLRTERIPFIQSRATLPLMASSFGTMAAGIAICYIPGLNSALSLTAIFPSYYAWLAGTVAAYCCAVQGIKWVYIKVFRSWL